MNKLIKAVEQMDVEGINFPILIGVEDCIWTEIDGHIIWNADDNSVDLWNGDGMTYSSHLPEGSVKTSDYTIANIDTQTGTWQTIILENSKYIDPNKLEQEMENL